MSKKTQSSRSKSKSPTATFEAVLGKPSSTIEKDKLRDAILHVYNNPQYYVDNRGRSFADKRLTDLLDIAKFQYPDMKINNQIINETYIKSSNPGDGEYEDEYDFDESPFDDDFDPTEFARGLSRSPSRSGNLNELDENHHGFKGGSKRKTKKSKKSKKVRKIKKSRRTKKSRKIKKNRKPRKTKKIRKRYGGQPQHHAEPEPRLVRKVLRIMSNKTGFGQHIVFENADHVFASEFGSVHTFPWNAQLGEYVQNENLMALVHPESLDKFNRILKELRYSEDGYTDSGSSGSEGDY